MASFGYEEGGGLGQGYVLITGQVQSVVFDGTRPLLTSLAVQRECAFPWLVQLTDVSGNVIDLSTTVVSGTTTTRWSAAIGIANDVGDSSTLLLAVYSATATAGGSQITFPTGGSDGEVLVYLSKADTALLPPLSAAKPSYCVFSFVVTDPNGVSETVARGLLYPAEHTLGAPS